MKLLFYIFFLSLLFGCNNETNEGSVVNSDSTTKKLSPAEDVTGVVRTLLPSPTSFHLREAKKWYDAAGENWLVLYETGSYIPKSTTGATAKLAAILYQKTDSGFVKQWTVNDFVADCELDMVCNFYENHLSISDLDQNGMAEVMMVYALSCKGDVSPDTKKLILYTNGNKYAIRGEELMVMAKDTIGGTAATDTSFQQLPKVIQDSAMKHWQKFGFTKYE
jgi:hypothetical protein